MKKKKQSRKGKRANNVFFDLGFPPHEAAVMLLRCELAGTALGAAP